MQSRTQLCLGEVCTRLGVTHESCRFRLSIGSLFDAKLVTFLEKGRNKVIHTLTYSASVTPHFDSRGVVE